jgi:DNA-binding NarL/FixJ family response regulator
MRRCLICDDHPLVLAALAITLGGRWPNMPIDTANDFAAALQFTENPPELILADLSMPGSEPLAGIKSLRKTYPQAKTLVFSGLVDDALLLDLVALPVNGFVAKTASPAVIIAAIELVLAGGLYLPHRIAELASRHRYSGGADAPLRVTGRQREVLKLLAAGQSNKEIAIALGLSPATVKTHVAQAMATIGAANRAEAAARAINLGLI